MDSVVRLIMKIYACVYFLSFCLFISNILLVGIWGVCVPRK